MTSETIKDYADTVLPHLVRLAQRRETIHYGELAAVAGMPHHRPLRLVLGYIRDEICRARSLPLITAIVVNQDTGMPGESFLPEGTERLSSEEYREKFEQHRNLVFRHAEWEELLHELGLPPLKKTPADLDEEARIYDAILKRAPGAGEGEDHEALKRYVAARPAFLGLYAHGVELEYRFLTGDRADIVFDLDRLGLAVVEIKVGERGELVLGVYQLVKYRALLEAERGHGEPFTVEAHLVAYAIPEEIGGFAQQFGIKPHVIARERVFGH